MSGKSDKDKVNLVRVGVILLIVAVSILVFCGKKVIGHIRPAEYVGDLATATLTDGQKISFDVESVLGVCYYDCSRGIVSENQVGDDIYGQGYVLPMCSASDNSIVIDSIVAIEVDSKRLYGKMEDITDCQLFAAGETVAPNREGGTQTRFTGVVTASDMNRYTDLYAFMVIQNGHGMEYSRDIADNLTIQLADGTESTYYIYVDDPVDDFAELSIGLVLLVAGVLLIRKGILNKKNRQ